MGLSPRRARRSARRRAPKARQEPQTAEASLPSGQGSWRPARAQVLPSCIRRAPDPACGHAPGLPVQVGKRYPLPTDSRRLYRANQTLSMALECHRPTLFRSIFRPRCWRIFVAKPGAIPASCPASRCARRTRVCAASFRNILLGQWTLFLGRQIDEQRLAAGPRPSYLDLRQCSANRAALIVSRP